MKLKHVAVLAVAVAALALAGRHASTLLGGTNGTYVYETADVTYGPIRKFVTTSGPVRALVTVS